jgi:hypothetical protein
MSLPIWAKIPVIGARKPIFSSCAIEGLVVNASAAHAANTFRFMLCLL